MKTMQKATLAFIVLVTAWSCNIEENKQLRATVDSLQTELTTSLEVAQTLSDVGVLIDSIDVSRNSLTTNMIEGTTYDNYTQRLNSINQYVKQSVRKIASLEQMMKNSKASNAKYASSLKQLKKDLEERSVQLTALQEEVEKIRSENTELYTVVKAKDEEIMQKTELIQLNQQSIASLEKRVDDMVKQSSVDQADAYFKEAQALELAAKRTKLAPRKKKATQQEALELYRLAATLGKEEAHPKIALLEDN